VEQLLEVEEEKKEVSAAGSLVIEIPANLSLLSYLGLLQQGVLSRDTLAVGMARLGQPTQQVHFGSLR
jgi:diphthamide biosynthesis methyltransferase